jgi:hypothetical protein
MRQDAHPSCLPPRKKRRGILAALQDASTPPGMTNSVIALFDCLGRLWQGEFQRLMAGPRPCDAQGVQRQ